MGPELCVVRENTPPVGWERVGEHRLCMVRGVRGRKGPGRSLCCWAEAGFGDGDAGGMQEVGKGCKTGVPSM